LRILHIENCASVPYYISKGLRQLGHTSDVLETAVVPQNYGEDKTIAISGSKFHKAINAARVVNYAMGYDLVVFHQGIRPERRDKRIIAKFKHYVIHYHGSESRLGTGMFLSDKAKHKIISTPDLLQYHPTATFIPNPFQADDFPESFDPIDANNPVKIVHLSTNRLLKGTDIVLEAIKDLNSYGLNFEFKLIEGVPRREALAEILGAHIVIDQINDYSKTKMPGLFGMVSLEAMSMGKVVISSLDEKMRPYYPENPIVSCPPDAGRLCEILQTLIEDDRTMKDIAIRGRTYVETFHSPIEIAKRNLEVYKEAFS
jgi:glycosyltransferase involved in cell wall biosynthesis